MSIDLDAIFNFGKAYGILQNNFDFCTDEQLKADYRSRMQHFYDQYQAAKSQQQPDAGVSLTQDGLAAPAPTQQPVECRETFEKWLGAKRERDQSDRYMDNWTQGLWSGWAGAWEFGIASMLKREAVQPVGCRECFEQVVMPEIEHRNESYKEGAWVGFLAAWKTSTMREALDDAIARVELEKLREYLFGIPKSEDKKSEQSNIDQCQQTT